MITIAQSLQEFYKKNNLSKNGGENDDWFQLKFKLFTLKLPNSDFRKKVIHVHDIQHVLYNCDTTWKGESFIAGWEIATNMWKHFPIGLMSLWAMGFSLFNYPKEVLKGYKKGLNTTGIIDLNMSKDELLNFSISELKIIVQKNKIKKMNGFQWIIFIFWCLISEVIFLFPVLILLIILF